MWLPCFGLEFRYCLYSRPQTGTYGSTHTHAEWSKRNSQTAEARAVQRLYAAAADRPNSSSSSTQQRRRHGSGGGQLRTSEPPIVRLMTLWPRVDVRQRTRRTHTQSKRNSQHSAHSRSNNSTTIICSSSSSSSDSSSSSSSSRQAQQQWLQHAAAAAARQRVRPATSERASYRPFDGSVPWWLHVIWVCHVLCVVCQLCCVTCALCCLLAVCCYDTCLIRGREWITLLSVCMCCSGFFATTRKYVCREKPSQDEKHYIFC